MTDLTAFSAEGEEKFSLGRVASLGVLAAGIAHEIRNPLTAIKVRLFSLKRSAPDLRLGLPVPPLAA